jgi:hypothetical protein
MNDRARWGLFGLLRLLDVIHHGEFHAQLAQIATQDLGLELPAVPPPPDPAPGGEADNEAEGGKEDDPTGLVLLADIRGIFATKSVDRISSEALCEALAGMKDRPWSTKSQGRPITKEQLAWLLRRFDIHPTTVRLPEKPLKGYYRDSFARAFSRHLPLPPPPQEPLHRCNPQKPWANEH